MMFVPTMASSVESDSRSTAKAENVGRQQEANKLITSVSTKGLLLKRRDFLDADDSSKTYSNRTYYFKRNEDLDGIIDTCSKKLQAEPQNLRALYLRGTSYMKKGTLDLAIRDLSFVINKQPDHVESLYSRGMTFSKMGKPELAIPDLTLVLELNPDHVNAAFARAACYNSMGLLTQAIEDYNFALFKDQTLNSPIREDNSTSGMTRSRTWSAASNSVMDSPFTPKGKDSFSVGFSPASSIAGSETFSNTKRLDVDATGIFSLYGVASPTIGSQRYNQRSATPSSEVFTPDAYTNDSPRPGSALSAASISSSSLNINLSRSSNINAAANTSTFKSLAQFRSQQQKDEDNSGNGNNPSSIQADKHHAAAYDFRKQGNYSAAIEEYSQALYYDNRHFKSLFNRGFAYDKVGQFVQAIQDYSAAIDINPEYAFCYYNRGITYDHMGDLQAAIKDFSKAISLQLNNVDFYHNRAYVYRKMQLWTEAIDDYNAILRFAPQNFKALFNRSLCLERKDQVKEAMDDINNALQQQPQHGGCFAHRAILFEKMENFDEAIGDFTTALMNGAQPFPTLSSRARVFTKLGKNDLAIADLTTCLEIQQNDLPTLFARATCFKTAQKLREAVADFSKVIAFLQDPSSSPVVNSDPAVVIAQQVLAFNQRGYCYRKMDMVENAIRDYSQAISLAPEQVRAYNNRGFLFAKCNRFEEAIADYTKAIELDPLNAYAYHNRGISYDKLGMIDQAIVDFGKVFELDSKQSLLANSGGNMNAMTSMVVPSASRGPFSTSPIQSNSPKTPVVNVIMNSSESINSNIASSEAGAGLQLRLPVPAISHGVPAPNRNGDPQVKNGNIQSNPLTKFTLRQQNEGRSKTPTNTSVSSSISSQPKAFAAESHLTQPPQSQQSTGVETAQTAPLLRSTSPSIIKRTNYPGMAKPEITSGQTKLSEGSILSSNKVSVKFAEAPTSVENVGTVRFHAKPELTIIRPEEEVDEFSYKVSPSSLSTAEIDEKLDTVTALLSKFGGSSSNNKPNSFAANDMAQTRPLRISLVAQPVRVENSARQSPIEDEKSQTDDTTSPKIISQGISAAQKFGVKLRSTSILSHSHSMATNDESNKEANVSKPPPAVSNRPRLFREPIPAPTPSDESGNSQMSSRNDVSNLPPSIAAPINAASFLAKLRESRQEEAKVLLAQQQSTADDPYVNAINRPSFLKRKDLPSGDGNVQDTILSQPLGKFSQIS